MYVVKDKVEEPLYVITPIFNPRRFKSRWKLYQRFRQMVHAAGGVLYTIEAAFGERSHAIEDIELREDQNGKKTKAKEHVKHRHIHVRTKDEVWIKENLINLAMARLPADWKYVAWIDADVAFARPNWVGETIHQLQHYDVVQMFSQAMDLGPNYEALAQHQGYVDCYLKGLPPRREEGGYYGSDSTPGTPRLWHPGFAWAARRRAVDNLGGLIDFAILGAGDHHMAGGLIGRVNHTVHAGMHEGYKAALQRWQERAERHVRRNVGVVEGMLLHYWHGKKKDRRYKDRWQILVEHQFRPDFDLKPDFQGVHQLVDHGDDRSRRLRDDVRAYFAARNEDSIDL